MDKAYNHKDAEEKIYRMWEKNGYFAPRIDPSKKPFTIILPPPNASGKMHIGNVLMIAIEDVLVRWHRMKGDPTLWIPGTDHAGFETQTTFERKLRKEGKSRFDFDNKTLYKMINAFVQENKPLIEKQLRNMGASVDWSRYRFTLDEYVVKTVYNTFKKLIDEGFIYRGDYLVNYSFKWGTTFSDAEIQYKEQTDPLYYIKYRFADNPDEYIEVATVRPELIMVDTHIAVNPKDKKHELLVGRRVLNPLTDNPMDIITDEFVDPEFGTGIVKLTPAHDKNDFQVAQKLGLPIINVIHWDGKLNNKAGDKYHGKKVKDARAEIVSELIEKGLLDSNKTDENYTHQVPVDYRSGDYIENLILPNWFVKTETLKKPAYEAVKKGDVKIFPKWRQITYLRWMENMRDWAISRQTVWGIRIPVWYEISDYPDNIWVSWKNSSGNIQHGPLQIFLQAGESLGDIENGLQKLVALAGKDQPSFVISDKKPEDGKKYLPETDTFDTWFSSGQWIQATLGYPDSPDYNYFYPISVLETGWEIVTRWVSRMMMFGMYLDPQNRPPFSHVYLHGTVKALDGRKMSKSLGNVINPEEYIEQYGVDALRMGLIAGTANGKDFSFPKDRVIAYKHFANKLWNMARFMLLLEEEYGKEIPLYTSDFFEECFAEKKLGDEDKEIVLELKKLIKSVDNALEKFRFADASEFIYQFTWHTLADKYIESIKKREEKGVGLTVLRHTYITCLKLLHPFMPFVTEEIYGRLGLEGSIMVSDWPV